MNGGIHIFRFLHTRMLDIQVAKLFLNSILKYSLLFKISLETGNLARLQSN